MKLLMKGEIERDRGQDTLYDGSVVVAILCTTPCTESALGHP